jgi:hypothetical protein
MIRFAPIPRLVAVLLSLLTLNATRALAEEPVLQPAPSAAQRPAALVPLYASFAALQMVDMHSTWRALDRGAVEGNPVMSGIAANKPVLLTVKAAGTAGVIAVSERLRKKSRTAALIFMISANSGMTWVVQHNYRTTR